MSGLYGVNYKINGHRVGCVAALPDGYHVKFERCYEENTLETIETINWQNVSVEQVRQDHPACPLPEGYSFGVVRIDYEMSSECFTVVLKAGKQYWGDVTSYQAQIDDLTASLSGKDAEIAALEQDKQASGAVAQTLAGAPVTSARAAVLRACIEQAADKLPDSDAVACPELSAPWRTGEDVTVGSRRSDPDAGGVLRLYKCAQAHTTQTGWEPHLTPAMWTVIDAEHEGTQDDPIPAARGMEYEYGKYYLDSEDGKTYLCERTGEAAGGTIVLQFLPHELIGQYFAAAE